MIDLKYQILASIYNKPGTISDLLKRKEFKEMTFYLINKIVMDLFNDKYVTFEVNEVVRCQKTKAYRKLSKLGMLS